MDKLQFGVHNRFWKYFLSMGNANEYFGACVVELQLHFRNNVFPIERGKLLLKPHDDKTVDACVYCS